MPGTGDIGGGSATFDLKLQSGPEVKLTDPDLDVDQGVLVITINVDNAYDPASGDPAPHEIVVPLKKDPKCVHLEWKNNKDLHNKRPGK